ncbi:phosphoenolpyruvate-protein phosphotransferase [Peptoanaerobacter stomatis]|uniref:Phosphoenolpyruvate-protein phosphotransferase n=1 Tax=Peptoanaerobacter stomatis TaxID=796937 RepID=J4WE66_9FIRM|nr:phosphoenolpyruvate--protein phosphotransferase [Peptoanaerobacter stomatis]EJU23651.1 phosphoenolpyruvate-protein phosphotransferase [Peptoanaerobacter stomatis]NWO24239.1 phosphoenolpyruvate--protein phosphotransferase [Peptostreptococcaceae bacterium oral taxon 081]
MKKLSVDKTSSKGIAIGKAYKYEKISFVPDMYVYNDKDEEIKIYKNATELVSDELTKLAQTNDIFAGHLELVNDVALLDEVTNKIVNDKKNVQIAFRDTIDEFVAMFEAMDNEYMKARADDIKDIYQRVMAKIKNVELKNLASIHTPTIVIAKDLAPSDTATMNLDYILGFATQGGGVTSHVCIMARNLGLPALVGADNLLEEVNDNDIIIIDATNGDIYINPDEATIKEFENKKSDFEKREKLLKENAHLEAITKDNKRVLVYSNVGNIEDIKNAVKCYIDGIGLFRSEFLYMENSHFPTEEEQFEVYKEAVQICTGEVIIRTLDIGGDKELSYYEFDKEENPFLGFRAIRISLHLKDMFKEQLRALLRASAFGYVSIMYPMIISLEELLEANSILDECKKELDSQNIAYNKDIKVGMMIETPASVMEAEAFAKYVDFFSIGTNDLTQYMLAVDRGNDKIADMYDSFNPAVLHAIQKVIDAGHKENIVVGMCGEFASDERACKMLLGMDLDEFSVAFTQVAAIKSIIRESDFEKCKEISEKIRFVHSKKEVNEILNMF